MLKKFVFLESVITKEVFGGERMRSESFLNLAVAQLVNKFPSLVPASSHFLVILILILPSHIPSGSFREFSCQIFVLISRIPMCAVSCAHIVVCDLIILMVLLELYNL